MTTESPDNQTADVRETEASTPEPPRRRDVRAEVDAKRRKIREDLRVLRQELRIFEIPEFIREHPMAVTAGVGVLGFLASRVLFGGSGGDRDGAAREELLDELLAAIIEDAAHRVAAGAETREALRTTLREHGPIVFEVEREDDRNARGAAGAIFHVAFDLAEPYLRSFVTSWLDDRLSPPNE